MLIKMRYPFVWMTISSFIIFCFIELCDALLPYGAVGSNFESNLFYYVINISVISTFFLSSLAVKKIVIGVHSSDSISKKIYSLTLLSLIGLILIAYDRVIVQGVDYTDGIALAREYWRQGAEDRSGVSSIFNVIGNLIFPSVFIAFVLAIFFNERLNAPKRDFILSFLSMVIFSALTGGREVLLVGIAFAIVGLTFRVSSNLSMIPGNLKGAVYIVAATVLVFSIYIGYQRSITYTAGLQWYSDSLAERLGGEYVSGSNLMFIKRMVPEIIMPVLIYFAHVKWSFINIIASQEVDGLSTFRLLIKLLTDFRVVEIFETASPSYSPNWITGTGSLYYDFGIFGMIIVVATIIFAAVIAMKLIRVGARSGSLALISLLFWVSSAYVMYPFAFMFEIVQFIYIVIPILLLIISMVKIR